MILIPKVVVQIRQVTREVCGVKAQVRKFTPRIREHTAEVRHFSEIRLTFYGCISFNE